MRWSSCRRAPPYDSVWWNSHQSDEPVQQPSTSSSVHQHQRAELSSDWLAGSLTGLWGPIGSDSLRRGRPDGSEWQGDWAGLPPLLLDASSSVSVSIPRLLSLVWVFGRTTSSPPAGRQTVTAHWRMQKVCTEARFTSNKISMQCRSERFNVGKLILYILYV